MFKETVTYTTVGLIGFAFLAILGLLAARDTLEASWFELSKK